MEEVEEGEERNRNITKDSFGEFIFIEQIQTNNFVIERRFGSSSSSSFPLRHLRHSLPEALKIPKAQQGF